MVDNITVKVGNYDDDTNTIQVSFSGVQDGVTYETGYIAFNPANYHSTDPDLAIKNIAQLGLSIIQAEIEKVKSAANKEFIEAIKTKAEQEFSFNAKDIVPFDINHALGTENNLEVKI